MHCLQGIPTTLEKEGTLVDPEPLEESHWRLRILPKSAGLSEIPNSSIHCLKEKPHQFRPRSATVADTAGVPVTKDSLSGLITSPQGRFPQKLMQTVEDRAFVPASQRFLVWGRERSQEIASASLVVMIPLVAGSTETPSL